jgi:hypothetical protein
MLQMLRKLCEANNIDTSQTACVALGQETSAEQMLQQIENSETEGMNRPE